MERLLCHYEIKVLDYIARAADAITDSHIPLRVESMVPSFK